jgi:hypothetical protein
LLLIADPTFVIIRNVEAEWTPLQFKAIDFNYGGGFNNDEGYLTAPVAGWYHFDLSIISVAGANNAYQIALADRSTSTIKARRELHDKYTAIAVNLLLEQGAEVAAYVWGVVKKPAEAAVDKDGGMRSLQFSGHLIAPSF